MSPKVLIAVLAGAFVGASTAYVVHEIPTTSIRLHAFESDGTVAAKSAQVARLAYPEPVPAPVELAPVSVVGKRQLRGIVRDALPLTCQPWRPLLSGPGAADVNAPMVRECDAAQMLDGTVPPPATARLPAPTSRPKAPVETWAFTEDLAAPR
jgi:hypothetical protein